MSEYLTTTSSLCAVCGKTIPAKIMLADKRAWFHKLCPEHGHQEALICGEADYYLETTHFHRQASMPLAFATSAKAGCPHACGICPEHEQHVCLPIIEITDHCNLTCPVCLVRNPGTYHYTPADVARILDGLIRSEGQIDVLNLSGGEPTLNPHFREIVTECLSRKEILRLSVSTNGLILAKDPDLRQFLAERRVIISMQFDGLSDEVFLKLRGRPMLAEKLQLIEACAALDAPMSLTATVARGVNEDQLAKITQLLFQHDHILSVMFQPATYAGHGAHWARPHDAITIPDVLAAIGQGADSTVSAQDFSPLPCSHPACFALAFYLKTGDARYMSVKQLVNADRYLDIIQNRAIFGTDSENFRQVMDAVYDLWSGPAGLAPDSTRALAAIKRLLITVTEADGYSPHKALQTAERAIKSIFIHQFMDPATFDLSRARKCCQVYPQRDGRLIPACVRNCLPGVSA